MRNLLWMAAFSAFLYACKNNNESIAANSPLYEKAKKFRTENNTDSAFYYYNLAKNEYLIQQDSTGAAKSLVNMAIIQTNDGDFYGGIETSLEADRLLQKRSDSTVKSTLAANYNNMAIASSFLKNHREALEYYQKALHFSHEDENRYVYYNNIGDALFSMGKYKEASAYFKKALTTENRMFYPMAVNNLAKSEYKKNNAYNPLPTFYKALKMRSENNDLLGQNSSFATLSDYFKTKNEALSLQYAQKLLHTADSIEIPEDQIQALERIVILDRDHYKENFEKLTHIKDSVQTARGKARSQFATVRYDVERLKAENAEKEIDVLQRNLGLGVLSLFIISGWLLNRKRKQSLILESENRLKEQQLKTSKKIHDVVANGIYQVMTKMENQEDFTKEEALDELEMVYEKSRNLSYNDDRRENQSFAFDISKLLASFKSNKVNTFVAGNEEMVWEGFSDSAKEEIYQIIRELLVNMKKHSHATRVILKFEKNSKHVDIQYSDNGVGIPGEIILKNGLSNTVSRTKHLLGTINFDTSTETGLKINISIPVS